MEKLEKLEPLCTVGGNVEGYILYGNTIQSIKKLDTELLRDPAVPLLSIYTLKNWKQELGEKFEHPRL